MAPTDVPDASRSGGIMEETSRDCQRYGPKLWNYAKISGPAFWTSWPKPVLAFKDEHFGRMN